MSRYVIQFMAVVLLSGAAYFGIVYAAVSVWEVLH